MASPSKGFYGALHVPTYNVHVSEHAYVRCLKPYVQAPDAWIALSALPAAPAFFKKWPWAMPPASSTHARPLTVSK